MKKSIIIISFILLCITSIVSVGVSIYLYTHVQKTGTVTQVKQDDDQQMLTIIGNAMVLPDEKPTIVSVTDRDKLQDQEFFKKALNGDKVVIFEGIRRIFLYRPSIKKIIDISPLVFNEQKPATASVSASISPKQATESAQPSVEEQGNFKL